MSWKGLTCVALLALPLALGADAPPRQELVPPQAAPEILWQFEAGG